jgi:hypothetical protein
MAACSFGSCMWHVQGSVIPYQYEFALGSALPTLIIVFNRPTSHITTNHGTALVQLQYRCANAAKVLSQFQHIDPCALSQSQFDQSLVRQCGSHSTSFPFDAHSLLFRRCRTR